MTDNTTYKDVFAAATEQSLAGLKQIQDANAKMLAAGIPTLPSPTEFVTAGFDAAGKLLEQQRTYTLRVAELFTPSAS
jgi:hypothetical protein